MKLPLAAARQIDARQGSRTITATSNRGARRLAAVAGLIVALTTINTQAAFQPVETFDDLTLGNINQQNGWLASPGSGEVVADPAGGNNQALEVSTESGTLEKAARVAEGTTRMLFLRLRFEEHGRYSFGLSHASNPEEFDDFGPELGMAASTAADPNNDFRVANGLSTEIYDVLTTLQPGVWHNLWVLVDTETNTYQVWLNSAGDAQPADQLANAAAETVFGFRTATATDLLSFFIKTGGGTSPVDGRFYLDDIYLEDTDAVNLSNPVEGIQLTAAVLPSSRSTQVGVAATAFASIINTDSMIDATDCFIAPGASVPGDFLYQTTDAETNELTGTANTPVPIAAGATQSYLIAFTPSEAFGPVDVPVNFDCANSSPAPVINGVNTLLLSASSTPVPDIVALAATLTSDGIVTLPPPVSSGAFAVATVNVGAQGEITASADTGDAVLPLNLSICETNPGSGECVSAPDLSTTVTIDAGATHTFGVFVNAGDSVAFDAAVNRIFVRFRDSGGEIRGSTSVAVRTLE